MKPWREEKKSVIVLLDGTHLEFYSNDNQVKVEAWKGILVKQGVFSVEEVRKLASKALAVGGRWLYK
jgi:predicted lactoylglutathione lyase